MTAAYLAPQPVFQGFTQNGAPLAGGLLYSYAAGTAIPLSTYVDNTGTTPNTNPVVLNSQGQANVWLTSNVGYKFVLTDSAGNQLWSVDQIFNAQLISYYGVDTGQVNAYVLTAATPYQAYTNGQLVFFVPGNTNTGAATVNINGLGVIPIITVTGAALGAGQIQAGIMAEMIYYNGSFQLISVSSFTGPTIGTLGQEVTIASAATTDLGTLPAHLGLITGTTAITSFGSSASVSAPIYFIRFAGALTLTYSSTALILPGAASITTSAGDSAIAQYLGSGFWKVLDYTYASSSSSQSKIKPSDTVLVSNATLTSDPDLQSNSLAIGRYSYELYLVFDSVSAGAGFKFTYNGTAVDSRGLLPALGYGYVNATAATSGTSFYGSTIAFATVGTGADSNQILYKGSILIATPGNFGISWAQNTSTASSTTLRAGSYLSLTQINTGTANNQIVRTYQTPGSGIETVPTGYTNMTIEVFGGSGGGGARYISGMVISGGGGGGSGGYAKTVVTVTGLGGATIAYTVGAAGIVANTGGGASSTGATTGGLTVAAMTANGGAVGGNASSATMAGAGGAGGMASGGTVVNTVGNTGAAGSPSILTGHGGLGGAGIAGVNGGGFAGGTGAGSQNLNPTGTNGGTGLIVITYS